MNGKCPTPRARKTGKSPTLSRGGGTLGDSLDTSITAEQLTKFVATVVIQVAQPQVCYPNPRQDMLDLKSSLCRKISNAAKNILKVGITGKELFESIGSLSAPAPPKPFTFTNAKVNSASKHPIKPSTLKSTSPPSISTKAVPKQPKTTN